MADTALGARPRPPHTANGAARRLRRRRALPGGRAVVGGFLVALAAVGTFAGYQRATGVETQTYLVARRDLPLGHLVTRADLAGQRIDLPAALRARTFRDPERLVGAMVIGPVARGELVQAGAVRTAAGRAGLGREISFPIEAARAVGGQLRPGELVDMLATYGTGAEATTAVVVAGARVVDRTTTDGGLTGRGDQVITLAVPSRQATLAVAHAVDAGEVTLVRAAPGGSDPGATDDRTPVASTTPPGSGPPATSVG